MNSKPSVISSKSDFKPNKTRIGKMRQAYLSRQDAGYHEYDKNYLGTSFKKSHQTRATDKTIVMNTLSPVMKRRQPLYQGHPKIKL